MHIMFLSLIGALAVCVLLLVAFWLFTLSPLAPRIVEAELRRNHAAASRVEAESP